MSKFSPPPSMPYLTSILKWGAVRACCHIFSVSFLRFFFWGLASGYQWAPWLCSSDSIRKRRKAPQCLGNIVPENGNLPARSNPERARKMKRRQISLALFIKFDNWYKPPEGGKCIIWKDLSHTLLSFSQSNVRHPWVHNHLHLQYCIWFYTHTSFSIFLIWLPVMIHSIFPL